MRRTAFAAAALALLFLVPAVLRAASVREKPAKCPYCAHEFQGLEVVAEDVSIGPPDPDLFVHPFNGAPKEYYTTWTCPACYYSALASEYGVALSEDDRKRIAAQVADLKWLKPEGMAEEPPSQIRIPAWFKYKAMYLCAKALGRPDSVLGNIALRGSWVTRVFHDPMDRDRRLAVAYKEIVQAFEARHKEEIAATTGFATYRVLLLHGRLAVDDLKGGKFTEDEKPLANFIAGYFLREGGDHRGAIAPLSEVVANPKTPPALKELASTELFLQKVEEEFQQLALQHFEKSLAAKEVADPERIASCTYLVGELYRRLGKDAEATQWFDRILKDEQAPKSFRQWADLQRKVITGGK